MKKLFLLSAFVFLLSAFPSRSEAATGCGYPSTLDTFADVATGQLLTASNYNKLQCAVEKLESTQIINRVLAANRPASPATNQVIVITDAASSTDCSATGGGSNKVTCQWNGSAWEAIGGGGGGSPAGSGSEVQFRGSGVFDSDSAFTYDKINQILAVMKLHLGDVSTNSLTFDSSAITGPKTVTWPNATGTVPVSANARKIVQIEVFGPTTATATGDGKRYFRVPSSFNGMNLLAVNAHVTTAGTTGTLNIDLARCAAATSGNVCSSTVVDMLSTNLTIDSGENDSATAAAAAVIDTANDDVSTGQIIRVDIDAIHTTPAQGLVVNMEFAL